MKSEEKKKYFSQSVTPFDNDIRKHNTNRINLPSMSSREQLSSQKADKDDDCYKNKTY